MHETWVARYLVAGARDAKINSPVGVFLLIKFEHPVETASPGQLRSYWGVPGDRTGFSPDEENPVLSQTFWGVVGCSFGNLKLF